MVCDDIYHNIIAKEIRQQYAEILQIENKQNKLMQATAITCLALKFAERFKAKHRNFDHLKWLDQCSPNPELYPFSDLWEER